MYVSVDIGSYSFSSLNDRQKFLALTHQAHENYLHRVSREKYLDWEAAANQKREELKRWPKDEEIRPDAIKAYEARVEREIRAGITEETKKLGDWLKAEKELKSGGYAYLPVTLVPQIKCRPLYSTGVSAVDEFGDIPERVIVGKFDFKDLTPEQKHWVTNETAFRIKEARIESENKDNWAKAAAEVRGKIRGFVSDSDIRPVARRIYQENMANTAELARKEKADWYAAEKGLADGSCPCELPVAMVPQQTPGVTWPTLKAA